MIFYLKCRMSMGRKFYYADKEDPASVRIMYHINNRSSGFFEEQLQFMKELAYLHGFSSTSITFSEE